MTTSKNLVTVLKCSRAWEAEIIRERLEAAGLMAFVQGGESATSLSYVGVALGGVRVQVPADQEAKARQLLEEDERQRETAGPWKCPRCNEPNAAGFDFCYSCAMPRGDTPASSLWDEEDEVAVESNERVDQPEHDGFLNPRNQVDFGAEDGNPYRFVGQTIERERATSNRLQPVNAKDADQLVSSAFRWAVIGILLPMPLFHLVSLGLLTQAGSEGAWRVAKLRRKAIMLLIVDVVLLLASTLILFSLFFG